MSAEASTRCVHFVGFRDDRYDEAIKVWGSPEFVHRLWTRRPESGIAPSDIVVFATGDWKRVAANPARR